MKKIRRMICTSLTMLMAILMCLGSSADGLGAQPVEAAHKHNWVSYSSTPATCSNLGCKKYRCSKCKKVKTTTIPKKAHSYQTVTTKNPTCTKSGQKVTKCSRCGTVKKTTSISPLGHKWGPGKRNKNKKKYGDYVTIYNCKRCSGWMGSYANP